MTSEATPKLQYCGERPLTRPAVAICVLMLSTALALSAPICEPICTYMPSAMRP